jgi:hypothetical protein
MSINDATPSDWDRVTKSRTPHGDAIAELEEYVDPYDQPPEDPVYAPAHYNTGNIECIEAIKESMTSDAFKGYCKGNALKYVWRMSYKGKPIEDLRKAIWYIERLIESELEHPTILKK